MLENPAAFQPRGFLYDLVIISYGDSAKKGEKNSLKGLTKIGGSAIITKETAILRYFGTNTGVEKGRDRAYSFV